MSNNTERRLFNGEVEVRTQGDKPVIDGYAAVFGARSKPMGTFVETVKSGAFTKTLNDGADVRAFFNHDMNLILGRRGAGTLDVSQDANGLHYRITPGNQSYARDLVESIERGDVNQSSFGFRVTPSGEQWAYEGGRAVRSLTEVMLFDVSPVTVPAYDATVVGLSQRSLQAVCELRGLDYKDLAHLEPTKAVQELLTASGEVRSEAAPVDVLAELGQLITEARTRLEAGELDAADLRVMATDLVALVPEPEAVTELEPEVQAPDNSVLRARLELKKRQPVAA